MRAYILIEVRTGAIRNVVQDLRRLEYVKRADMTFGSYDAVAEVEADDLASLGDLIAQQIQTIPGVLDTVTCLAVEIS